MNQYEVIAEPRGSLGKGASRRLRRTGAVPAVLYGSEKEPVSISLEGNRIRKQLENEAFAAHILTVKLEGEETQAVLKDVQRDPATDQITHMDFLRVSATHEIQMHVPLHFANEETCPGKKAGGVITHLVVEVEITCLPKDLPEYIEVDLGALDIGDSVHLSELKLPDGVILAALAHNPDNDQPVVSLQHAQKLEVEEEELEGEEAEGEVGADEVPTTSDSDDEGESED